MLEYRKVKVFGEMYRGINNSVIDPYRINILI